MDGSCPEFNEEARQGGQDGKKEEKFFIVNYDYYY